jgi:hypothetical protein
MATLAILQLARNPREQVRDLIIEADARTLGIFDPGIVNEPEPMSPEDWDEFTFFDAVATIERLGSHFIQRCQDRWNAMAKATAAVMVSTEPEDMPF